MRRITGVKQQLQEQLTKLAVTDLEPQLIARDYVGSNYLRLT
jgi:hypothetical protein